MGGDVNYQSSDKVLVQWWHYPPYVASIGSTIPPAVQPSITTNSNKHFTGVFYGVLQEILSNCHPDMNTKQGGNFESQRVPNQIAFHTHLSSPLPDSSSTVIYLPVSVRRSSDAILQTLKLREEDYQFLALVESPGSVLFYLNEGEAVGSDLLDVILQSWPMIIFILLGAGYSGIIIWLTKSKIMATHG